MCAAQFRHRPTPSSIHHPLCVCCMQEGVITGPTPVVEAGPPRMREVWLQGSTVAGGMLQAGSWYWGGVQGASRYTWIRITADGERIETATRQCDDPTTPLPVRHCIALPCLALPCVVCGSHNAHLSHCAVFGVLQQAVDDAAAVDADARCYRVPASDVGCVIKVAVEPVRDDGTTVHTVLHRLLLLLVVAMTAVGAH